MPNQRSPLVSDPGPTFGTPHAPDDVTGHRTRARYTTKIERSFDDMAAKLHPVIIAARFHSPCPEQATPLETQAVLAAWAAVSQAAGVVLVETVRAVGSVEATRARRHPASRA
jgi:hypothetical protein